MPRALRAVAPPLHYQDSRTERCAGFYPLHTRACGPPPSRASQSGVCRYPAQSVPPRPRPSQASPSRRSSDPLKATRYPGSRLVPRVVWLKYHPSHAHREVSSRAPLCVRGVTKLAVTTPIQRSTAYGKAVLARIHPQLICIPSYSSRTLDRVNGRDAHRGTQTVPLTRKHCARGLRDA